MPKTRLRARRCQGVYFAELPPADGKSQSSDGFTLPPPQPCSMQPRPVATDVTVPAPATAAHLCPSIRSFRRVMDR